jgi:hypothetical protein
MNKHLVFFLIHTALSFILISTMAQARLTVAPVFGDHMVLQREMKLPVWGVAEPGSNVTVRFGKQSHKTKVNRDGSRKVALDVMEASSKPQKLTIRSGSENKRDRHPYCDRCGCSIHRHTLSKKCDSLYHDRITAWSYPGVFSVTLSRGVFERHRSVDLFRSNRFYFRLCTRCLIRAATNHPMEALRVE